MDPSSTSSYSSSNICHPNANWIAFSLADPAPPISPFPLFRPEEPPSGSVPKLADFLGGTALAVHFPEDSPVVVPPSDLNTFAASFLRGFSDEQQLHRTQEQPGKKAVDTFGQRTSIYRGVTRHRWTGRYEAHLWDNSCRREGQSRKGRQVYLGGYDKEDKAARAYDLAALKYWGPTTTTNFPVCNYEREVEEMKHRTRQEFVASLRRKSSGFSRGASIYRGVTRHHQHGRWQARIGRVAGNKDLYLGTFSTQEEAAEAYDIAAIKFRGLNAVTNFDMSRYDVKSIMSSNLPIGGMSGKSRHSPDSTDSDNRSMDGRSRSDDRDGFSSASSLSFTTHHQLNQQQTNNPSSSSTQLSFAIPVKTDPADYWPIQAYNHHRSDCNIPPFLHSSALYENRHHQNFFDFQGGSIYVQPQQHCDVAALPYATVTATADSNGTSGGNWMKIGLPPQSNLHSFHTPLYGME